MSHAAHSYTASFPHHLPTQSLHENDKFLYTQDTSLRTWGQDKLIVALAQYVQWIGVECVVRCYSGMICRSRKVIVTVQTVALLHSM